MTQVAERRQGSNKTKIVATLGPATSNSEMIESLIRAGVDVFRLNFSHGTWEDHASTFQKVREASATVGRLVGILMDLGGPKIRLDPLPNDIIYCTRGDDYILSSEPLGLDHSFTCSYRELPDDLRVGTTVLFADGLVAMEVVEQTPGQAKLRVTIPGEIRTRQGVNVPDSGLSLPSLTEKDLNDLNWAAEHDVDFIALSFVRTAEDMKRLRGELKRLDINAKVIAKIEKPQAVECLPEILGLSDGVMVARGDLGVEVDVARVPAIQKQIIREAHRVGIPVITATQMLTSMEHTTRPTRAEASDVYNAVLDGTDAVMLSGETAIGEFPVETVQMMGRILHEAEQTDTTFSTPAPDNLSREWVSPITCAVVESAALAAKQIGARLIVVVTRSGRAALAMSMQRARAMTIGVSGNLRVARSLTLSRGILPLYLPEGISKMTLAVEFVIDWAKGRGMLQNGDQIVVLRGFVDHSPSHNVMIVQEITDL